MSEDFEFSFIPEETEQKSRHQVQKIHILVLITTMNMQKTCNRYCR